MNLDEIIELLKKWSEFKTIHKGQGFSDFGRWLANSDIQQKNENPSPIIKTGKPLTEEYSDQTQFLASYFLKRMNKFIRIYTKDIFDNYGLNGSDDFSFLALIDKMDSPNKKELCTVNLTEITTGMDIIKKLVKTGLAEEIPDETDKRSKRMIITPKGKEIVEKVYQKLREMSEDVLGDLNQQERAVIIQFLARLNTYHTKNVMKK